MSQRKVDLVVVLAVLTFLFVSMVGNIFLYHQNAILNTKLTAEMNANQMRRSLVAHQAIIKKLPQLRLSKLQYEFLGINVNETKTDSSHNHTGE